MTQPQFEAKYIDLILSVIVHLLPFKLPSQHELVWTCEYSNWPRINDSENNVILLRRNNVKRNSILHLTSVKLNWLERSNGKAMKWITKSVHENMIDDQFIRMNTHGRWLNPKNSRTHPSYNFVLVNGWKNLYSQLECVIIFFSQPIIVCASDASITSFMGGRRYYYEIDIHQQTSFLIKKKDFRQIYWRASHHFIYPSIAICRFATTMSSFFLSYYSNW